MSPADLIVLLTIFLFLFFFLRGVGEEEEGLVKAFYGKLALATENAFQNVLILVPSRPCLPLPWASQFLVEGEGMPMATGDKASPDLSPEIPGPPGTPPPPSQRPHLLDHSTSQ